MRGLLIICGAIFVSAAFVGESEARNRGGPSTSDTKQVFESNAAAAEEMTEADTSTRDRELLENAIPGGCFDESCRNQGAVAAQGGGGGGDTHCIPFYDKNGHPTDLNTCNFNPLADALSTKDELRE